jgi:TonB family protein
MTVPLTRDAFNIRTAHPLRLALRKPARGWSRIGAVVVTLLAHIVVAAALITGLRVAHTITPHAMSVHIEPEKKLQPRDAAPPPPMLTRPDLITAPAPEVVIETRTSPVAVQPPPGAPAPQTPSAGVTGKAVGEARQAFLARLLARLNRFKRYPPQARKAHIEGVVMLHFVMDANGNVRTAEIAKSSGRPLLDKEALALIRRAQPLPALPAGFPGNVLDAEVPIVFSLSD